MRPIEHSDKAQNVVLIWPDNAFPIFLVLVVLGFLFIKYWLWTRPCEACGESPRENCRCRAREYGNPYDK